MGEEKDISPPELARLAVEQFISGGEIIRPPTELRGVLAERAGVFVSLHTTDGRLRGCIGTINPAKATVAEEIICNALSAATCDPRFAPVTPPELPGLTYGVDVLAPLEAARGPEDLDPARYGVLIEGEDGRRRGLLLPRIEGIETVEEQWRIVHQKAGIRLGEPVRVQRFTVTRFGKD
ncbi:MAG TPA: AmmeMemoRadiSam system protein A [Blastocatellia bacterium]|nr:AmmeMemoRadiSam system protein A [Blastocatellia bacterium]